ncbi:MULTISPECIES: hypothetical protein [Pseudonocardia]|uniref:Cell division protein FtsL n=2 Tax=Pseudonocardia TaxID=1847 RepID=A0A1Y2MQ21_PSEAH|nr:MULTISPECIES: hypothetical protein [Pseudonocardia]OSY37320.1 Cell division protein FtsL [Pseudonocardia autotrophica]TDN72383.1 hypothetical protein C8E95_1439 [Pseudonocardia autotrophica]BBG03091.1 hypothetical protein Pdca_43000 [Pseudonocardia autotrophica]GEC23711.1 hypothetical protein PSA01_07400 [Pseudonocardia saturnea]
MSTPVIERPGTPGSRPRPQTRRSAAPPRIPAQRGPGENRRAQEQRRTRAVARENTGRAKFVLVVMVLLAVGLIATLWLSTAAAADSYRLQDARQQTAALTERSEALRKEVTVLQSPGSLAQRASAQGMVPVADPARLVVGPDGQVEVIGEPRAAVPAAPPAPAPDPADPAAPADQPDPEAVPPPAAPTGGTSDPQAEGGDAAASAGAEAGAEIDQQEGADSEAPADARAAGGQD